MKNKTSINRPTAIKIMACNLLLAVVFLCGCSSETEQQTLEKLRTPVVVVAIDKVGNDCAKSGAITLKDGDGKLWSFGCITDIARSVSNSRQVGDTLK